MKKLFNNIYLKVLSLLLVIMAGCTDILEEQPRSILTPQYFETAGGLQAAIVAAYALNRYYYGTEGGLNMTEGFGNDAFTHAQQTNNPPLNTYVSLTPGEGSLGALWNWAYPAINTCNGIIQFADIATDISDAERVQFVAEAKFIRAHWYFLLVQTFGGVTLDLGAGPLQFNAEPASDQTRASTGEVWAAIISDLEDAVADLPETQVARGRAWKATALHVLAKAYLTRGQSDDAEGSDLQNALTAAQDLIDNRGAYGVSLLSDFADVHAEGNEDNNEILWTAERNQDVNFNDINGDGGRQNRSNFYFRSFYVQDHPGMIRDVTNGRPWIRYRPTPWLVDVAFGDKDNDTRYFKSFQSVYIANNTDLSVYPTWSQEDADNGYIPAGESVGDRKFTLGDTAIWFMPNTIADAIPDGEKEEFAAQKGFRVWYPDEMNAQNKHYPSLSKFNALARPVGTGPTDPNIASTRPFIVYRFAETLLIGAEAAILTGQTSLAVDYLNEVRERAGVGGGNPAALTITASDVTLDFILDERARELAGEQMRWFDLVRTGKLLERVSGSGDPAVYNRQYNDGAPAPGQLAPNPQPFHVLRPIPQAQIDRVTGAGGYPQNPGYN